MSRTPGVVSEAVTIGAGEGRALFGVLSRRVCAAAPGSPVVVVAGKTGPGDMWRWFAEALASRGAVVLRFEPAGLGDSPGGDASADIPIEQYFRGVQEGSHRESIGFALRWVREAYPASPVHLLGICGNCPAVLRTAADMPRDVAGVILTTPPVLYMTLPQTVSSREAQALSRGYVRRLLDPASYKKLLTGGSDHRVILSLMGWWLRRPLTLVARLFARLDRSPKPVHPEFNRYFWDAFRGTMAHRIPVLAVLGALDPTLPEFEAEFQRPVLDRHPDYARLCTVDVLPETDHSFSFDAGRRRALESMAGWLQLKDEALPVKLAS